MSYFEQTARARQLYLDGQPQKDIARALGVSKTTVTNWKQQEGWPTPPRAAAKATQRKAAFGLFREGHPQQAIAQRMGVSENTIVAWKKEGHWVARMSLLQDKALDEALTQVSKVIDNQLAFYHTHKLTHPAESLKRAFAYLRERLDRGEEPAAP